MKQFTLLLAASMLAVSPLFSQKTAKKQAASSIVELAEAVAKHLVKLDATGPGGHELVNISIENPGGSTVKLRIPQGQLMLPADGGEQTLVVAEEQLVVVSSKKKKSVELKTFCTEPSDASPHAGTQFSVGAMAVEPVVKMLRFLAEKGRLADGSAQSAIWSVCETGHFSPAGIGDGEMTAQACQILNRRPPEYRIRYEVRNVPGQPGFEGKALVVDGNYTYVLSKDEKLTLTLFGADGKAVKVLYKDKPYTAGEHRASLHLEVKGLKQGIYSVKLTTGSGEVVKEQEVEF